jgi:hypothetical protein
MVTGPRSAHRPSLEYCTAVIASLTAVQCAEGSGVVTGRALRARPPREYCTAVIASLTSVQ